MPGGRCQSSELGKGTGKDGSAKSNVGQLSKELFQVHEALRNREEPTVVSSWGLDYCNVVMILWEGTGIDCMIHLKMEKHHKLPIIPRSIVLRVVVILDDQNLWLRQGNKSS